MPVTHDDLPCRELVELVTDYLEGALQETERLRFEAHLDECDACALYVRQLRVTIETVGRMPVDSLSAASRERLRAAFHAFSATPPD
jgi:anti-sigma factor RsiW